MILNLIVYLFVTSVEGGRVYKRRNISEQAWSGVDTGISINSERLDSVLMDSIMTAKLQCSIECDNNKLCGLFQLLEGEGLSCILAQLYYWTFEEQFTGPEVEVYIRKDRMVDAGREVSIDEEIFIFFYIQCMEIGVIGLIGPAATAILVDTSLLLNSHTQDTN